MATTARSRQRSSQRSSRATGNSRRTAASSRRAPSRSRRPDALRMLKEDHQRVKQMFDRFERAQSSSKDQLARTICEELKVHAQLEEELFYPAVRDAIDDDELIEEADVEHATAKYLIAQIEDSSPSDEHFDAMVKVLGEYIQHHVKEEEGEIFRKVRRSRLDTAALGERMEDRKSSLTDAMEDGRGMRGRRLFGQSA